MHQLHDWLVDREDALVGRIVSRYHHSQIQLLKSDQLSQVKEEAVQLANLRKQLHQQHSLDREMVRLQKTTSGMVQQREPIAFLLTWGAAEKNELEHKVTTHVY